MIAYLEKGNLFQKNDISCISKLLYLTFSFVDSRQRGVKDDLLGYVYLGSGRYVPRYSK